MEGLIAALQQHRIIGFDTSTFIYHLEDASPYAALTTIAFGELEHGRFQGITSVLTLMELSVRPFQLGLPDVATAYELALLSFPNLSVVGIDRSVAMRGAALRAKFRLRAPDALQVATSLEHGATAFLSNDSGLRRLLEPEVLILDDFLES